MHIHTLRHTPPFSQPAYTNSKPKISWNNAFSVKPKRKNSQPSLRKLTSSTDVLMHAHTQLMTGIILIKNWQSRGFVSVVCGLIYMLFADQFLDWYPSVVFWSVSLLFVDRCICGLLINVSVVCGLIDLWFADQRFCGLWTDVSVVCWSVFMWCMDWYICGLLINVCGLMNLWFADQCLCGLWIDRSVVCWSTFLWFLNGCICGLLINVYVVYRLIYLCFADQCLWFVDCWVWFADQHFCGLWTDVSGLRINVYVVYGLMYLVCWSMFVDWWICGLLINVSVVCGLLYLWFAGQHLWFVDHYICGLLVSICGLWIDISVICWLHDISVDWWLLIQLWCIQCLKCLEECFRFF